MTLIDFGDFKLRFDPKEVRINIDGEIIDVGARRIEEFPEDVLAGDLPTASELEEMERYGIRDYKIFKRMVEKSNQK